MLPDNDSANGVFKETILNALNDERIAGSIRDDMLYSAIQKEMERGEYDMDTELIDACSQLLWNRHSTITPRQLGKIERRSFKRFRRYIKRSTAPSQPKRFPLRPVVAVAMLLFLIVSPLLVTNPPFKIIMPNHEEQYLVVGIKKNDTGIARASMNKGTIGTTIELDNLEAIALHLGYTIELPAWIPEECTLEKVVLDRDAAYDELFVTYAGQDDKRVSILVTYYETREGHSASYEQIEKGQQVFLQNGASVYVANNINSVWGLYQSSNVDYYLDTKGFEQEVLLKIFNSIGDADETE